MKMSQKRFEEMKQFFPDMMESVNPQPKKLNNSAEETIPGYPIIILLKTTDKEKNVKSSQRETDILFAGFK